MLESEALSMLDAEFASFRPWKNLTFISPVRMTAELAPIQSLAEVVPDGFHMEARFKVPKYPCCTERM